MKDKTGPGNDGTELLPRPCPRPHSELRKSAKRERHTRTSLATPRGRKGIPGSVSIPGSISRGADKRGSIRPRRQNLEG